MALEDLPPVHRFWTLKDLDGLTRDELMKLQLMLKSKMEVVGDRYERELYRMDRYEWLQLKALAYRERPKSDYPF
jgi:hypothetical protein